MVLFAATDFGAEICFWFGVLTAVYFACLMAFAIRKANRDYDRPQAEIAPQSEPRSDD